MDMEHMSNEDALRRLAHVTPHALTEFPSFPNVPRAIVARDTGRTEPGRLTVVFDCVDVANDVSYAVEVPMGEVPQTSEQGQLRLLECAAQATVIADRNARAVWN